jgi:MFS family permease
MDIWSTGLFALFLLSVAAGLMVSHARSWLAMRSAQLEPREADYRRRQFRRRMQTSAMLGVLGVAIFVGHLLTAWVASRLFAVFYWGGVLLLLGWMALLALADILATKFHFSRLRQDYMVEQAKLQAELRRIQAKRANGRAK